MAFEIDRLERDPRGFFGLEDGFTTRDLQRAYHGAIRQFRPDSHPREFQRIREARDRLLEEARWREGREGADPPEAPGGVTAEPAAVALAFATPQQREETYRSLAASPGGARGYATLALFSETVPSSGRGFESWILEGLERHPDDEGLEALVRLYVQEELPDGAVPRFLRTASRKVPRARFWVLFAGAWETAATTTAVRDFEALWDDCEDDGELSDEAARAWLLARLLPSLVARSDGAWVAEKMRWVATRHEQAGDGAVVLDALEDWEPLRAALAASKAPLEPRESWARAWRRLLDRPTGPARLPRGEASALLRRLAEALLGAGIRGGEARLRAAAREVVDRQDVILRGFPARDPETVPLLRFLQRGSALIARDVAPSFEPTTDQNEEADLIYAVHRRCAKARRWSLAGFLEWLSGGSVIIRLVDVLAWVAAVTAVVWAVIGLILIVSLLGRRGMYGWLQFVLGTALVALLGWGVVWLYKHWFWVGKWLMERSLRACERYGYRSRGRAVAIEAIRELGLSPDAFVDPERLAPLHWDPSLARGVAEDPALWILWVAHRYAA